MSSSTHEGRVLVIDNGTTIKAGLSGDDKIQAVFCVGLRYQADRDYAINTYVGRDMLKWHELLDMNCPVQYGVITNWANMETVWRHAFDNELQASPEHHPILMTERVMTPKSGREKMTEILFESFQAPAFYVSPTNTLSLLAIGRTTGISAVSGEDETTVVPIYEGFALQSHSRFLGFGGDALTEDMRRRLRDAGHFTSVSVEKERDIAREIKERHCYVPASFEAEVMRFGQQESTAARYKLPDGREIVLGNEIVATPETCFNPSHIGLDSYNPGLHHAVFGCAFKSMVGIQRELLGNIVLSGRGMMFPGLAERLGMELGHYMSAVEKRLQEAREQGIQIADGTAVPKVVAAPKGRSLPWIGGSMVASSDYFRKMCISKKEYEEVGVGIVHQKCL